jgi:hypothetical protein
VHTLFVALVTVVVLLPTAIRLVVELVRGDDR